MQRRTFQSVSDCTVRDTLKGAEHQLRVNSTNKPTVLSIKYFINPPPCDPSGLEVKAGHKTKGMNSDKFL